jgi:DNA helicase-2/ATP-dependent DNA helicase PcrA
VEAATRSTAHALRAIRDGIGLGATLDTLDASRAGADRSTHADDLAALESIAAFHPDSRTFAHWLREVLGRSAASGPRVELSTIHRIKGKEWGHVVVFGASAGLFPHRLSEDVEGERRILHVALTRAGIQAVFLADRDAPSVFLAELDGKGPHTPPPVPGSARPAAVAGGDRRRGGGAAAPGAVPGVGSAGEKVLRAWRSSVARNEGVPAYVVLNDKELVGIAERNPTTLRELGQCRGMGPIRLERWGDEILGVLEGAADLSAHP